MNDQLKSAIDAAEKELADLKAQIDPLEAEHEQLDERLAPLLDRQGVLEEQIAAIFPRKVELEHQLEHLRKINADFSLEQRAKIADVGLEDAALEEEKTEGKPPA
jgi:chromosome segregation ATPase